MPAKKTKDSSDVTSKGVVSGKQVNMPGESREKGSGRSVTQMNEHPGLIFKEENVYGSVREVDQEATERYHNANKNSGTE